MTSLWLAVLLLVFGVTGARADIPPSVPPRLKTLSYNVWGAPFAGKRAKRRMPRIAAKIRAISPDIVAFSEAFEGCFVSAGAKTLIRLSGYEYYERGAGPKGAKCVSSGLLIASKYPIIESADLAYGSCTGIDCVARKGVAFARIQVPFFGEVDVYVTHTDAGDKGAEVRERQLEGASNFIDRHSGDGSRLVLFMGDFNAEPDAPELQKLQTRLALRDSYHEYVSTHEVDDIARNGYTSDPARNANVKSRNPNLGKRIDYILYREGSMTPARVAVERSRLAMDEIADRGKPLSDHFGVATDFVLD